MLPVDSVYVWENDGRTSVKTFDVQFAAEVVTFSSLLARVYSLTLERVFLAYPETRAVS